jgi:hypothetical protein
MFGGELALQRENAGAKEGEIFISLDRIGSIRPGDGDDVLFRRIVDTGFQPDDLVPSFK